MAFNREDLITWNELAPSLQSIFKTLQEEVNDSSIKSLKLATLLDTKTDEAQVESIIESYIVNKVIPTLPTINQVAILSDRIDELNGIIQNHINNSSIHNN